MKKTLLSLFTVLTVGSVSAQYEGFENWTQNSVLNLDGYETAVSDWGVEGAQFFIRSTDAIDGLYSVRLETIVTSRGDTAFGYILSGDPENMTPGQPVSLTNVDSITGFYKCDIMSGDSVTFLPMTFFMGTATGPVSGSPFFFTGTQPTWKRFAFYIGAIDADSLLLAIANGDPLVEFQGIPGTWAQFDNIQLKSTTGVTQNILNHSFEDWTPTVWEEPTGWFTSNTWAIGEPVMPIVKTNDSYAGNYALEVNMILNSRGDTVWGVASNGEMGQNGPSGGAPYTSSPTSVEFYYKYAPSGSDTAGVSIEFKQAGFPSQWAGSQIFGTTSSYTLASNSIPPITPDTLLINIMAGQNIGSQLKIDNINFVFPVGVSEVLKIEKLVAYPNPVKDVLNIRFNLNENKEVGIRLLDVTGKVISTSNLGNLSSGVYNHQFNTSKYNSGIYFIEFVLDGEKMVERFVVQ